MLKRKLLNVQRFYTLRSIPIALLCRRNLTAREVLTRFLARPEEFFLGTAVRQAPKVHKALQAFKAIGDKDPCAVAARLLRRVRELKQTNYRPFFVMGSGGSGSTWLGAMLGDLPGLCYGGEIYVPKGLSYLYRIRKSQELRDMIWAIMLLPSWTSREPAKAFDCEFVNSGRSIFCYDIYHDIWPRGRFIFLVRDPRDQLLSTTYRKARYRQSVAPKVDDFTYLKYNAKKSMSIYRAFTKIRREDLYVVKYEQLVHDTIGELTRLLRWAEAEIKESLIYNVANQLDAQNMRGGKVVWRGNLDEGGTAGSWRDLMTEQEKRIVKPIIQEAIEAFGYEQNATW